MIVKLIFILLATVLMIYYYRTKGANRTYNEFLNPVMMFLPVFFMVELTPGLPQVTFYIAAAFPMLLMVLWDYRFPVRFGLMDLLVILFMVQAGFAAAVATDPKYGILTFLDKVTGAGLAYFLTRILVPREAILRSLVWMAFFITLLGVLAPLEYLFNLNPLQVIQKIWPDWVMWNSFVRGGFHRVYSTFGHPIHAGMLFSIGLFVGFVAYRLKIFRNKNIPLLMMGINAVAIFTTVSRTSYALAIPILLMINFAFVKKKTVYAWVLSITFGVALAIIIPIMQDYMTITDLAKADETQTSAAYRNELFGNYMVKVMESPWVGYGLTIPVVNRQDSIDNYFLYLALRFGIPSFVLLSLMFVVAIVQGQAAYRRMQHSKDRVLLWTILSILAYCIAMCTAVWFAGQARDMLFMLFALAATLLVPAKEVDPPWSMKMKWL